MYMYDIENKIKYIKYAIMEAEVAIDSGEGGPFGAVIVNINNPSEIFKAHNTVLLNNDPTCHAEMNVIREACNYYRTYDLSNILNEGQETYKEFVLYTTSYPCPMCLGAIKWAGIKHVVYCGDLEDTAKIGFKDATMYKEFNANNKGLKTFTQLLPEYTRELFIEYNKRKDKIIY